VTAAEPRRPRLPTAAVVLIAFCILVGLGVWQAKRLKWKTDLLHRIAALQTAPAEPAGPVLARIGDGLDVNFVRAALPCPELERTPTLRVYAVVEGQAGYRFVTACPLTSGPYRSLLVDRGIVPLERAGAALPPGGRSGRRSSACCASPTRRASSPRRTSRSGTSGTGATSRPWPRRCTPPARRR